MKRILAFFMAMAIGFSMVVCVPVSAAIIGEVIHTDIVTYIDEQPIESYNIHDYTYVVAEDLQNYGFSVRWLAEERKLEIYERGGELPAQYPSKSLVNRKKDETKRGTHAFYVYETDIVTTLNGEVVQAYNVDGQTLIQVDELARFAHFSYNDERREVKIGKAAWYADWLYEQSAKEELALPCDSRDSVVFYSGDVYGGKPNGIGRITEMYQNEGEGLRYREGIVTTAKFNEGIVDDTVVQYQYKIRVPENGTDKRTRETFSFTAGAGIGETMCYSVTLYDDGTKERTEEKRISGRVVYRRESVYDPSYRFGYRITQEGPVSATGSYADYQPFLAGAPIHIEARAFTGLITDENGVLFATGHTDAKGGSHPVPLKLRENVKMAATENMYIGTDDVLYQGDRAVAKDVLWASSRVYLTKDGALYQMNGTPIDKGVSQASADDGLVLYIKGGNAYYLRLNFEEEGSRWSDDLDLSTPVKVFEGAKYVSRGNRFLVVDNDGTLWGWSSYWYGTPYQDKTGNLFSCKTPIKIAEDVAFADSGSGFIAYVTTDGTLYAMPDITEPKNKAIFDITEPVALGEHVTEMSAGGSYLFYVADGKLFAWGENKEGRLGTGDTQHQRVPVLVSAFYQ